jgi:hypothetical protein
MKTGVERLGATFLSGGRDARPPGNARFQRENGAPRERRSPDRRGESLTQRVNGLRLFSPRFTRCQDRFRRFNCGFGDERP